MKKTSQEEKIKPKVQIDTCPCVSANFDEQAAKEDNIEKVFYSRILCCNVLFALFPAVSPAADASGVTVFYVTPYENSAHWAGRSNVYSDFQQAVDDAAQSAPAEVWVAEGIYYPSSHPNGGSDMREMHYAMRNGVTIIGGLSGTETSNTPQGSETTFSGDISVLGHKYDNLYRVFYHPEGTNLDNSAVLKNVTISDGWMINSDSTVLVYKEGAGIHIYNGSPIIEACIFKNNCASLSGHGGGAMYLHGGAPIIRDCVFIGNSAIAGGGLCSAADDLTLISCTFIDNMGSEGGGMWNGGHASIIDCTFAENNATFGGGIYNSGDSAAFITASTFVDNNASFAGGGIYDHFGNTINHRLHHSR